MTFAIRQIDLVFTTPNTEPLVLPNIKCMATITNPGGLNAYGQLQLKVWGMTLDQMNLYSSVGTNQVALQKQTVTVFAGNQGGAMNQVFSGAVVSSYLDFNHQPEISFNCAAVAGFEEKGTPVAPNSWPNSNNAEDVIAGLVSQMGEPWTFQKYPGTHAVLQNQYVSGSIIDQITTIAKNARLPLKIENNTVYLWPNDGYVDDVVVEIGPASGLVGYPSYWESGFVVKSEFKAEAVNGRAVNLTSAIPKANGKFPIIQSTHELATWTADGPWFTISKLSPSPYVPSN